MSFPPSLTAEWCKAVPKVSTTLPRFRLPKDNSDTGLGPLPAEFMPRRNNGGHDAACGEMLKAFVDAVKRTDKGFWTMVRDVTDPKGHPPAISVDAMVEELRRRINIPDVIPLDFDLDALLCAATECDAISPITVDTTPTGIFSTDLTMDLTGAVMDIGPFPVVHESTHAFSRRSRS